MTHMAMTFENRTVHGVIEQLAAECSDKNFLTCEGEEFTYGEMNNAANKMAAGLQKIGVKKNDKVAIMMSNRPEFLFTWFGLCKLGAVEVPVNTAHKGAVLSYMLNMSDSVILILEMDFVQQIKDILPQLTKLRHIVILGGDRDLNVADAAGLDHRTIPYGQISKNDGNFEPCLVLPSDPCAIMFTSGTTGPSKGAVVPHNYQLVMAEIICGMAEYSDEDCLYNALPLFHGNAQTLSTMPALISGARMVLSKKFSATRFWDDIRRYNCTEFNYIGGILAILLKAEPKESDGDNPIRVMIGAGANKEIFTAFEDRFNVQLVEGYGMSEIGTPLNTSPGDRRPGSCGTLNPGYQIKLVDDEGQEVGTDTPGELLIRPLQDHSMMLEYYNMPEKQLRHGKISGSIPVIICKKMPRDIIILSTGKKMPCAAGERIFPPLKWSKASIATRQFWNLPLLP
ncbi:MAG: AMP-binding protein [Emcibacter sp.]|nr:AMP-binding protein [Emcibacter sp.]